MTLALPAMDDLQRVVLAELVQDVASGEYDVMRPQLHAAEQKWIWLSPPVVSTAAAIICVVAHELDERPWQVTDELWDEHLPNKRPSGRSEWRKATLTLHAAASLAGGVWLDVGRSESYWRSPLWPVGLDVIELLAQVPLERTSLTPTLLGARLTHLLDLPLPPSDLT